jgi:hypothetical protein
MIESALSYLLSSDYAGSASGAIVGVGVFPDELPQPPPARCIRYQIISGPRHYSHDGPSGLVNHRVQIEGYGPSAFEANRVRDAVIATLGGFKGTVPISPPVRIQGAFADNEGDSADRETQPAGPRTFRRRVDFIIWSEEG